MAESYSVAINCKDVPYRPKFAHLLVLFSLHLHKGVEQVKDKGVRLWR